MAVIVGAWVFLPSCGSAPNDVRFKNRNPITGETEIHYVRSSDEESLPDGWEPCRETDFALTIDGRQYQIRLCIACNPLLPRCIYVNHDSCDPENPNWIMYCESTVRGSPDGPSRVPIDNAEGCYERGTVIVDAAEQVGMFRFITECPQAMPSLLLGDVNLNGEPWSRFTGDRIPAGTHIDFHGNFSDAAFTLNALNKQWATWIDVGTGDRIDFGIGLVHFDDHRIPIAIIGVDGEILHQEVVAEVER